MQKCTRSSHGPVHICAVLCLGRCSLLWLGVLFPFFRRRGRGCEPLGTPRAGRLIWVALVRRLLFDGDLAVVEIEVVSVVALVTAAVVVVVVAGSGTAITEGWLQGDVRLLLDATLAGTPAAVARSAASAPLAIAGSAAFPVAGGSGASAAFLFPA